MYGHWSFGGQVGGARVVGFLQPPLTQLLFLPGQFEVLL